MIVDYLDWPFMYIHCDFNRACSPDTTAGMLVYQRKRDFEQIAMGTVVTDAESWGEYITAAHQISTLSKLGPNSDYGVSFSLVFAVMTSFRETKDFIFLSYEQGLISD